MNIDILIKQSVTEAIQKIYHSEIETESIQIQLTRKEFEGDLTVVIFPYTRFSKKNPEQTGQKRQHVEVLIADEGARHAQRQTGNQNPHAGPSRRLGRFLNGLAAQPKQDGCKERHQPTMRILRAIPGG